VSHKSRGQGVPSACQNEAGVIDTGQYPEDREPDSTRGVAGGRCRRNVFASNGSGSQLDSVLRGAMRWND
jgi:hypothetical protein